MGTRAVSVCLTLHGCVQVSSQDTTFFIEATQIHTTNVFASPGLEQQRDACTVGRNEYYNLCASRCCFCSMPTKSGANASN